MPKQCVLNLGGKAPALVLDDANIKDAVEAVVFGAFSNAGQIRMSEKRVIVHTSSSEVQRAPAAKHRRTEIRDYEDDPEVSISGLYSPTSATRILAG
ncbi:hypothetical protein DL770_007897 [Monosporascus sp. CRB-9-2]|nr:hypothetical protein DL770_007897 [Monosporascus sp. CRB-9-2]